MHRLFDPNLTSTMVPGMQYVGSGAEAHHAVRVKHVRDGEVVEILNGQGLRASGKVSAADRKRGELTIEIEAVEQFPLPTGGVIVASAVPKGSRADGMVDQLSQLGVARWMPMICRHSVVKPGGGGGGGGGRSGKIQKWQRITIESAKQCGRPYLLEIGEPRVFAEVLRTLAGSCGRIFIADQGGVSAGVLFAMDEGKEETKNAKTASGNENGLQSLGVLIGPEGGFSEAEYELADRIGRTEQLCLGQHTLRIETAAVAGAVVLMRLVDEADTN